MARFRYLFWDWELTRLIDALPVQNATAMWQTSAPGTFTATIPLTNPAYPSSRVMAATIPMKTRFYLERDSSLVWGGWLVEPRQYDSAGKLLTISAEETAGYFSSRYVPTLKLFGQDQVAIAQQLITAMQAVPGGDASLTVTAVNGMSGVLRDGVYSKWDFTQGLQALTDLTEMASGFEFASAVSWNEGVPADELLIAYPYLGRRRAASPLVIEYNMTGGGNCLSYTWPEGPGLATRVWGSATTPEGVQLVASADNTGLLNAGYPLIETKADFSSSKPTTQGALQRYVNRQAGWVNGERTAAVFTVRPTENFKLGMFTTGDDVLVRITDRRFPPGPGGRPGFAGWMRIGQVQCTTDASGLEMYAVTTLDYTEPV